MTTKSPYERVTQFKKLSYFDKFLKSKYSKKLLDTFKQYNISDDHLDKNPIVALITHEIEGTSIIQFLEAFVGGGDKKGS